MPIIGLSDKLSTVKWKWMSLSHVRLYNPMDSSLSFFSVHGGSPGQNTGVGSHYLLQGIFPTQVLNPSFPHCRRILYCLGHQGSPIVTHSINSVYMSIPISQSEKAMAPHSSTPAWKIPWTEEPGRLQSMGLQRVGHNWATSLSLFTFMHWRRKWQPTLVFLPGESQGLGSLLGCRLWGRTEWDTTEVT